MMPTNATHIAQIVVTPGLGIESGPQQEGSQGTGLAQSCGRKTQGQRGVRGSGGSSAMCNPQAEWKNPFSRVVGGFSLPYPP